MSFACSLSHSRHLWPLWIQYSLNSVHWRTYFHRWDCSERTVQYCIFTVNYTPINLRLHLKYIHVWLHYSNLLHQLFIAKIINISSSLESSCLACLWLNKRSEVWTVGMCCWLSSCAEHTAGRLAPMLKANSDLLSDQIPANMPRTTALGLPHPHPHPLLPHQHSTGLSTEWHGDQHPY